MTLSITALRALLAAGTRGPWRATKGLGSASVVASDCAVYINVNRDGLYIDDTVHRWQADAELIVAAHEALPELLDEVERLQRLALEACEVALHSSPTVENRRRVETIRKVSR